MASFIIIDNNQKNGETLASYLKTLSTFNSLGVVSNYDEALNSCLQLLPEIIFINIDDSINQPFYFIKELQELNDFSPIIIGMSKHKENAYAAIKNNMTDLLLLPLKELDVRISILKTIKLLESKRSSTLCLKSYKDFRYLNTDEILFLKADNNTTDFYMKDERVITAYKTLKTFESRLPKAFIRIHKSYIINSKHISRINFGKLQCSFKNHKADIPFTKTYINEIKSLNTRLSQNYETSLKRLSS